MLKEAQPKYNNNGIKQRYWVCECQCENKTIREVLQSNLKHGNTKSCGCLNTERIIKYNKQIKKKYNTYNLTGEYGIGYLKDGQEFYFDLEDYDKIKNYYWQINAKGYIYTLANINNDFKRENIGLHRIIMDCQNKIVDHIYHNLKDNRKSQLRIVNNQENCCNMSISKNNTSGVTGVSQRSDNGKWTAYLTYKGTRIHLGSFDNFEDAVVVRKSAEIKYFGEYRNTSI